MGDVADDMMDEAMAWAYESEVCANGHRFIERGYGCPTCEMEAEEDPELERRIEEADAMLRARGGDDG